jgi:shikimate 5-dehydrogenase
MNLQINKDTKLYGSFSNNPGNNGCIFFNNAFQKYGINAIYKSFYTTDIQLTIQSVKHLGFSGFALSAPYKISVIPFLDELECVAKNIGAVNTVLIKNEKLIGYNTDYIGIVDFFSYINITNDIYIIGNGGFSKAIQYVCESENIGYTLIDRVGVLNIDDVSNQLFINATPVDIMSKNNKIIDLRPHTDYGKLVSNYQAIQQFKLYTTLRYENS